MRGTKRPAPSRVAGLVAGFLLLGAGALLGRSAWTGAAGWASALACAPALYLIAYSAWAHRTARKEPDEGLRLLSDVSLPRCALIIAVRNEPPALVARTVDAARMTLTSGARVVLVDNESASEFASVYKEFETRDCVVIREPRSALRQFGAQLAGARCCDEEWLALLDADYRPDEDWLRDALFTATRLGVDALGYPQRYREDGRAITRFANSILAFESEIENPCRSRANAHTISGTMILVRRRDFVAYYSQLRRAVFTADYGFSLWLHARGRRIGLYDVVRGTGSSPESLVDLAIQQAKWADDIPQYVRVAARGELGWSLRRHCHFAFHPFRHVLPTVILAGAAVLGYEVGLVLAVCFGLLAWSGFLVLLFDRRYLVPRDSWLLLAWPPLLTMVLLARAISRFLPASAWREPTRKEANS